jgi:hypothetical protein
VLARFQKKTRVVTVSGGVTGGGPKESDRRHSRLAQAREAENNDYVNVYQRSRYWRRKRYS